MMPEMDGLQATQCIRSFDHDIPIVAMTANAFMEDKIKAKKAGMNAHLSKPLDKDKLIRVIAKLCKKIELDNFWTLDNDSVNKMGEMVLEVRKALFIIDAI